MTLTFAKDERGILPDSMIERLAADGAIRREKDFAPDQIQPASLDLRLGSVAYRVRASFLPGSTTVARRIDELTLHQFPLKDGAVLIDAGTSESGGALMGDADPACADKCSVFTPVPGGVGPVAVAALFENAVTLLERAMKA